MVRRAAPGCLVAAGLVLLLVWGLTWQTSRYTRRFPDGSTFRLTSLTYDGVQMRSLGSAWERLHDWVVPTAIVRTRLGGLFDFDLAGRKSIVMTGTYLSSQLRDLKIVFADDLGYEYGTNLWGHQGNASVTTTMNVPGRRPVTTTFWELSQFPRRHPALRTRFYERLTPKHWTLAAQMLLPNPAFGPYPEWKPERLPATRRTPDFAVTLKSVITGVTKESRSRRAGPGEETWTSIVLHEQPARNGELWDAEEISFSDATGNTWQPAGQWLDVLPNGDVARRFNCGLWPEESAYRLRIAYRRAEGKAPYDGKPRNFDFTVHVAPFAGREQAP